MSPRALVFAAALLLMLSGCMTPPRVAASGTFAGYALEGPVDHEVAREYLEGRRLPPSLEALRQSILASRSVPSREMLQRISNNYSPDVATLLLLETLSANPETRDLRARYERELARVVEVGIGRARPTVPDDVLILMVPGWFYESHGSETNADFRIQRELFREWGIPHRLLSIDENGAVHDNARRVADAIRALSDKRVFVVSASKSGAEVAEALGKQLRADEAGHVTGWLSIVGAVRGSPLADRVLEPDLCWLAETELAAEGFDLGGLRSLRASTARRTFEGLRFPQHIRIFSVVAVPLSGQISDRGAFGYSLMRNLGPNDGLTLLSDELIPGAVPLLLTGKDHFLGPDDQRAWSTAIFRTLMPVLEEYETTSPEGRISTR